MVWSTIKGIGLNLNPFWFNGSKQSLLNPNKKGL
jgi:hypothetical protein